MSHPLHTLALWAPASEHVSAIVGGTPVALRRDDDGWWSAPEVALVGPYRFVVDGDEIPDPRSCHQPDGVDGGSWPLAPYDWHDAGWIGRPLVDEVILELHVGTFTPEGTLDAAIDRLDDLVDLGITAVEVMPLATFPGERGWGYDGVLLYAVHPAYGGPDAFRRFVDACHARHLAVVLDVVYNHLGPSGNHLPRLGPYFTNAHSTPWGAAVNLDQPGSDEVRRFFVDNATMWIRDFHVDGLRLDAVHAFHDDSAASGREPFLAQLTRAVRAAADAVGRVVFVIGESDLNDPTLVDPGPDAPAALDAVWSDDLHHALHVALTREADGYYADYVGWEDVARALERVYVYDGRMSMHRGRQHGSPVDDRPRRAFVVSVQNHDQVGNRATGTRLGHLVGPAELEAAAAVVLCSPFVPMLFQGEEWAASTPFLYATDHTDPAIAEAVTTGRRREFGSFVSFTDEVPDPQAEATFRASVLDWDEREHDPHASVLRWYRRLIEMRRTHPALRTHGPLDTSAAWHPDTGAFVMMRGQRLMVVVAAGDEPVDVSTLARQGDVLLTNDTTWGDDGVLAPGCTVVVDVVGSSAPST
ncbi:MAG: malto-oligosyltrehalose trehalohydrolase [Acidimicrobiales bacterium]|nr:malto-oligosyltrehalose trehalohydrolase [Acidimicrobiales bacterium]